MSQQVRLSVDAEQAGLGAANAKVLSQDLSLKTVEDKKAQEYYDSEDAYNFYLAVWGGELLLDAEMV